MEDVAERVRGVSGVLPGEVVAAFNGLLEEGVGVEVGDRMPDDEACERGERQASDRDRWCPVRERGREQGSWRGGDPPYGRTVRRRALWLTPANAAGLYWRFAIAYRSRVGPVRRALHNAGIA